MFFLQAGEKGRCSYHVADCAEFYYQNVFFYFVKEFTDASVFVNAASAAFFVRTARNVASEKSAIRF